MNNDDSINRDSAEISPVSDGKKHWRKPKLQTLDLGRTRSGPVSQTAETGPSHPS